MRFNDVIKELAQKCNNNAMARLLFRTPYRLWRDSCSNRKLNNFHKNGLDVLKVFNQCLNEQNIKYSLAFGTLLGAIREHGFIPHDDDIDVTIWIEDYSEKLVEYLEKEGFKHKASFSVANDKYAKEDTFEYKGVLLDIFYVYQEPNRIPYCCYFETQPDCATRSESVKKYGGLFTRKIGLPISKEIIRVDFLGIDVSIPSNYDEVLKTVFGDSYMIPIKGFDHKDYSEPMPEWLCDYIEFK